MSKQKKKKNKHEDCLFVTPLSIDDCLLRLEAMANKDLQIESQVHTDYQAEVQLTERRNDDVPLYVTARLQDTKRGTCVTLNRRPHLKYEPDTSSWQYSRRRSGAFTLLVSAGIFAAWGVATHRVDWLMLSIVCILPMALFLGWLSVNDSPQIEVLTDKTNSRRLNALMDDRYDRLKSDVRKLLQVDSGDTRYDEVGNAYHIDSSQGKREKR